MLLRFIGLVGALALLGAALGWIVGTVILGSGYGPAVAVVTAIVGALLGWALAASRPERVAGQPTTSAAASPPHDRQTTRHGQQSKVMVTRSGPDGDARVVGKRARRKQR